MSFKKLIASIIALVCLVVTANAQVTVTLYDSDGKPVADATVEANRKVIGKTDANGSVVLDVTYLNKQLCFSHINFELFCEKATANVNKFTLKSNENFLDAAVVTSYENTTRRNTVGNVSSIDMSKVPVLNNSNSLSALQGLATGLDIQVSGGGLGQASKVRVQGDQSLLFSAPPIYVVDGFIISEYETNSISKMQMGNNSYLLPNIENQNSRGNFMDMIDLNNIESITILKDADALGIYGSRAANGAIVIKTKKSITDNIQVTINNNISWQPRRLELMNTEDYLKMRKLAIENSNTINFFGQDYYSITLFDSTEDNNWQNLIMGHSSKNFGIGFNISTNSNYSSNRFSINFKKNQHFYDQNGKFEILNISNNLKKEFLNGNLNLNFTTNLFYNNSNQNINDLTYTSITLEPNFPLEVWNSKEILWKYKNNQLYDSYYLNPLAKNLSTYKFNDFNILNTFNGNLNINKNISYSLHLSLLNSYKNDEDILKLNESGLLIHGFEFLGNKSTRNTYMKNINFDKFITFKNISIKDIKFNNIIGVNYNSSLSKSVLSRANGITLDGFEDDYNKYTNKNLVNENVYYKYLAFYNRFVSNFKSIQLNFNYRYDGSSRFSVENRWSSFYSFGLGWSLNEILFKRNSNIYLKPRITYGKIGNDNIPDYEYIRKYDYTSSLNYPNGFLVRELNLYSENFKWEDLRKLNIGIDFKYKDFSLILDYSISRSKDQLIDYTIPKYLGQNSIFKNFPGVFLIKSLEINLSKRIFINKNSNFNIQTLFTLPYNKLVDFPDIEKSSYANIFVLGKSKDISKQYQNAGIDKNTGKYVYIDNDGNHISNLYLSKFQLVETPVLYYGSVILSYNIKKINISTNINFRKSINSNNGKYYYTSSDVGAGNKHNNLKKLLDDNFDVNENYKYQKFFDIQQVLPIGENELWKSYYVRINNISFTYNISLKQNKRIDISLYINNLLLKTNINTLNYESFNNYYLPSLLNTGININLNF